MRRFALTALAALALGLSAAPAAAQKIENPVAVFSGLDKITGRIINFEAAIDETVQFGALQLTARVCYTRPPTESPNTTSFIEVDELSLDGSLARIFSGWIYANSPGLNAIEHPVYDIWLVDCLPAPAAEIAEDVGPDDPGTLADHPLPPPRPLL
ncbi:DUF2155 domain-containing protein [Salinarimonas ramus]